MAETKKPRYQVQFRATKEIKEKLEAMAEAEERSVSNLTRMIVSNYLKDLENKKRA